MRASRVLSGLLVVLALAGCTASWQAPLETRSAGGTPQPLPSGATRYRVVSGDTLHGIAWRAGSDWRDIARWNGLRHPYTIYPGQVLRLEAPPARAVTRAHRPSQPKVEHPPSTEVTRPQQTASTTPPPEQSRPRPAPPPKAPPAASKGGPLVWAWPASGRVTSGFAGADPARKGIKIAGSPGEAIRAAEGGEVVYSGSGLIGYGRLIIVKHNENYLSAYGHNRKLLVKEGDRVTKGEQIAEMGESNKGQPLLHFEIRRDGKPVDPVRLLPRR